MSHEDAQEQKISYHLLSPSKGTIFNSEAVRGFPDIITKILQGLALKALESDPTPLFDVIESYCTIALSGLPLTWSNGSPSLFISLP